MQEFHLAQLNIAKMKAELDDPLMQDFVANLDKVNSIADNSPGFVWRLQDEAGDATELRVFEDNMLLINMSVWRDIETLKTFVYESFHVEILKRRKEWFDRIAEVYQVLWWTPSTHLPDIEEAKARLDYLQAQGNSAFAFSFRHYFAPSSAHLQLPPE